MMPNSELGDLLMKYDQPKAAVEAIVALAVRRGGPDNATCVALFVDAV
jgi:serine/threonine protein phosphatase PrpC